MTPNIKAVIERVNMIFKFEYPNIFKATKSVLDLIEITNHIAAIKIIKGNNLIIKFGINITVKTKGRPMPVSRFLKNSISSKRFIIIPRQIKIRNTFNIIFKKPKTKYLFKILSINSFSQILTY
tara:strand:- start:109 stop:480 length:372 start_codon:yes stop_codon:yes gene_type:complete